MTGAAMPSALDINLIERVNVGDILTRTAELYPDRTAVVEGSRRLRYADFERQVHRIGHGLLALGLQHQDVVAVMARNCTELLLTYFACARAGLICAPVNLGLKPAEIAWCLRDAKARVLVIEGGLADAARAVLAEPLPDLVRRFWIGAGLPDDAQPFEALAAAGTDTPLEVQVADRDTVQLLYTSGTTANPKGVLTSHLAVTMAALSNALGHGCTPGYTALVALPLFHCAMLNSVVTPVLLVGGTLVLTQGFEPRQAAQLFEAEGIHMMVLLPMMYGLLLGDPELGSKTFPDRKSVV
jgi:acyl-CoA synthetase (AMP-forming)/AMP-acid ligase II